MKPKRIAELRELCEKATAGPWGTYGGPHQKGHEAGDGQTFGSVEHTEPLGRMFGYLLPLKPNTQFVIAARTALPEALDEIERLQNLLDTRAPPVGPGR